MISPDEVKHIAKLSALKLSDKEVKKYSEQLSSVLEYVAKLAKIKTKNIEPLFQVTDLKNVTRKDLARPSLVDKEKFLNAAGNRRGDFILAEKIFERE